MKKIRSFGLVLTLSAMLPAQDMLFIHLSNNQTLGAPLSMLKELTFSDFGRLLNLNFNDTTIQYSSAQIDSLSFARSSDTVSIEYHNSYVAIVNPLAFKGVAVSVKGTAVTIQASDEAQNVCYKLSGVTGNGSLKISSAKKFTLLLNNITITNPSGPAINIQCRKTTTITMLNGTVNTLTDGAIYNDTIINESGMIEEQDAALFSEGPLIFQGNGVLVINGRGSGKHGLCSDDFIQINGGEIAINSATKDGIHANDGITITKGSLKVTAVGDAIDGGNGCIAIAGGDLTVRSTGAGGNGITCDSTMVITGGTITVSISGDQSKGLKSGKYMVLSGGQITINTSGNVVLEASGSGYDPAYCTAVKCDSLLTINGTDITITCTGKGGKGIASKGDIRILSGNVVVTTSGNGATYKNTTGTTDAYNATCITADGDITISGGNCAVRSSGTAGKGITADGKLIIGDNDSMPTVTITTSGSKILISGSGMSANYAEAKAISCEGAVVINNGTVTIASADDGIKSTNAVTINGGTVTITQSTEGIEAPNITINNGTVSIVSSDDGFNATKGSGGERNDGSILCLNGGVVTVNSSNGDALDSNGNIVMTGGTVVAHGPTSQPEVGADYNGTFNISGGLLLYTGPNSGQMIEATSTSSSQYALKVTFSSLLNSSTLFHLQDASGGYVVTFKPVRNIYYLVFSSPQLKTGTTYSIYTGGTSSGSFQNGLYIGGTYSGGTLRKSFTISGKVTSISL